MVTYRPVALALGICLALFVGACSKDSTPAPTPTCAFTVAAGTTTFTSDGGTSSATVTVTAGSGCTWTATSSAGFVTITAGSSGSGNGTVQYSVAANAGADRTATLTIAGSSVTITQRAPAVNPPPPTPVTLSAPSANSPIGGVALMPGRPTLVINNSTATGSPGTVTYRFELSELSTFPNDPGRTFGVDNIPQGAGGTTSWTLDRDLGQGFPWYWRARATNGTVTSAFSNIESFIIQGPCTTTLTPTSLAANPAGESSQFTVTTGNTCSFTAASNDAWITITSGASRTGSGPVAFTVAANSAGSARTGTITVSSAAGNFTFTVTQAVGCTFNPSPNSVNFTNAAFTAQTFVVDTADPTCAWSVMPDSPWITIDAGGSNTGRGTVTYSIQANGTGMQRIGNINITGTVSGAAVFAITQAP